MCTVFSLASRLSVLAHKMFKFMVFVLLSSHLVAEEVARLHERDVIVEQGQLLISATQEPFSGVLEGKDYEREVVAGRFNGLSTYYRRDGALKSQTMFKNNAAHGKVMWFYPNGQVSYIGYRWQGRENGQKTQCFDEQGQTLERCTQYSMTGGEHGEAP